MPRGVAAALLALTVLLCALQPIAARHTSEAGHVEKDARPELVQLQAQLNRLSGSRRSGGHQPQPLPRGRTGDAGPADTTALREQEARLRSALPAAAEAAAAAATDDSSASQQLGTQPSMAPLQGALGQLASAPPQRRVEADLQEAKHFVAQLAVSRASGVRASDAECDAAQYSNNATFLNDTYTLFWLLKGSVISVCAQVRSATPLGWIGFGLSDTGEQDKMVNADLIIGRMVDGTWSVGDYYAESGNASDVKLDTVRGGRDSLLKRGGGRAGSTVGALKFERKLDTLDVFDRPISATAPTAVMVAYQNSGNDAITHHGPTRKRALVHFGANAAVSPAAATTTEPTTTAAGTTTMAVTTVPPTTLAAAATDAPSPADATDGTQSPEATTSALASITVTSTSSTATQVPGAAEAPTTTTTLQATTTTTTPQATTTGHPAVTAPSTDATSATAKPTTSGGVETTPPFETPAPGNGAPLTLVMAATVFRGGIRTPVMALPGTVKDWDGKGIPAGLYRLTRDGLAQMMALGTALRTQYRSLLLWPETGAPADDAVAMRATDHPWSMMSAQAVLRGIFPEKWRAPNVPHVFPIKVNVDRDDLLLLAPRNCPLYHFEIAQSVQSLKNPAWAALLLRAQPLLEHFRVMYTLPPLTTADIKLQNWDFFYDPVECYNAQNNQDFSPRNLSATQMAEVLQIGNQLDYTIRQIMAVCWAAI